MLAYSLAVTSLIGRVRRNNEDNFSIDSEMLPLTHGNSILKEMLLSSSEPHLLGVYDGMGGYSSGENASFIMATAVSKNKKRLAEQKDHARVLSELCFEANDQVCIAADGNQMGTTCALLCLDNNRYTVCNIGDSPIFLIREGKLEQISVDHNQKATYEKATGKAARPDQKFKLTQCIGIPKDEMLIEPYTASGEIKENDVFILCSDGVTDMVSREELCSIASSSRSTAEMVSDISNRALDAGGRDNITLICTKVVTVQKAERKLTSFLKGLFH